MVIMSIPMSELSTTLDEIIKSVPLAKNIHIIQILQRNLGLVFEGVARYKQPECVGTQSGLVAEGIQKKVCMDTYRDAYYSAKYRESCPWISGW